MSERDDELNDQGDYVSGEIGEDGKGILVGKNLTQRNQQNENEQRNQIRLENNIVLPDLNGRNPTVADLYDIIAYNRLTGEPGLVGKVNQVTTRLTTVESKVDVLGGTVGTMDTRLINVEELVNKRNIENKGKVHMSNRELVALILIIFVLGSFVAPWLWRIGSGGALNGFFGYSIFFSGLVDHSAACRGWLCAIQAATQATGLWADFFGL